MCFKSFQSVSVGSADSQVTLRGISEAFQAVQKGYKRFHTDHSSRSDDRLASAPFVAAVLFSLTGNLTFTEVPVYEFSEEMRKTAQNGA